jgi:hypothetical protein
LPASQDATWGYWYIDWTILDSAATGLYDVKVETNGKSTTSTGRFTVAAGLLVDSRFDVSGDTATLRADGSGQDWYESRGAYSGGDSTKLDLDISDIGGNTGAKAKLTGQAGATSPNTYLTQPLSSTQTTTFTYQFDIYVDQIFDRTTVTTDDRGPCICAGYDDGASNGPVSRGAERFVYLMFFKDGGASTGAVSFGSRTSGGAQATLIGSLNLDQWYTMKITVKVASNTYDVEVYDGATLVLSSLNIAAATGSIPITHISFQTWNDGAATFYVDNVLAP